MSFHIINPQSPKQTRVDTYGALVLATDFSTSFIGQNMYMTTMEQHTLKNVNNCLNNNIYSYLQTSDGQSS